MDNKKINASALLLSILEDTISTLSKVEALSEMLLKSDKDKEEFKKLSSEKRKEIISSIETKHSDGLQMIQSMQSANLL